MCGIAGYIQRREAPPADILRMTGRLAHRGPDGSGSWTAEFGDWMIALGHRRLSIIDIEGGSQPMSDPSGSAQITYNGEIYNFQRLRSELERAGVQFRTRCDTEVVLHQCLHHGADGLAQFDGMFAFGLWDATRQTLLLARDRAGIKPLYYAPLPCGGVAFASELGALLEHPGVDQTLDASGLASYFFSDYAHAPATVLRGARKLEPGHYLQWSREGLSESKPFWSLDDRQTGVGNCEHAVDEISARLRIVLEQTVEAQLVADVPVGVFLSGGIDSSTVAALAARRSNHRLKTFSIGFEDPDFDESEFARAVADHIGSEHIEERFSEQTLLQTIGEALDCLDEPMADPSILPTYLLSRVAAKHVKVALGGDGGDELWGGYPTYQAHAYAEAYRRIPRLVRKHLVETVASRLPLSDGYQTFEWKAKRFTLRWDDDARVRHLRWMSNTDVADLNELFGERMDPPQIAASSLNHSELAPIDQILALDFATYLPGSVLAKVDRASMAHGLEVRPPMLGNALIDFAFSLPSSLKMRHGRPKHLLKQAASGLLPSQIIARKKKGFAIPLARWLRGPLRLHVQAVLRDSPLWDAGLFRQETVKGWYEQHQRRIVDRARPLWAMLILDHWLKRHQEFM